MKKDPGRKEILTKARNEKREGSGSIAGQVFRLQMERLCLGYTGGYEFKLVRNKTQGCLGGRT